MTGSLFSAACCFWQPAAKSVAAAQASNKKMYGRDEGRGGDDGKADDVAILLMVPLGSAYAIPDGGTSRITARIIDRREKETVSA
ncbi:hypothetical protein [Mesorhizobium silamurunense]|uniref:hypothetical protein n=1 Tax=Mesorhizobium silamurunense TaxID=499528 RepID=UPI001FEC0F01|nr:hypothetical protein [Mesorhizobium silamurunense]